jgi:hypothetical protein
LAIGGKMLDFFIFFVFISSFLFLVYDNAKIRRALYRVSKKLLQASIDNDILKDDVSVKNSQEYSNFLINSRDQAYSYIETVQDGVAKFVSEIEPEINYFKEYGDIGSMAPNYYSMKKIVEEYEQLKMLLPIEEDKK